VQLDTALPWLALCLTRGIAARLSARLLKQFGSPESVFRAPLRQLQGCELPAATAQAILKKEAFKRAEKELAGIGAIPGCQLVNWSEPEYPQTLLQIYDPPVLLYVRGDAQILNARAQPRGCGHPPANFLWNADGGPPGARSGGTRNRDRQRPGARH
jgi:predicted Rossmann fold nucleotide-binding protein DprA/Smf involved in DNA uptake